MNADEPTPDLSETLGEIAEQAKTVDLSQAVARKVRSLRRRRNATGGAAAVVAVVLVAGGGYALTRTTGSPSEAGEVGGAAAPSSSVLYAVSTYVSPSATLTPAAPSSGIVTTPAEVAPVLPGITHSHPSTTSAAPAPSVTPTTVRPISPNPAPPTPPAVVTHTTQPPAPTSLSPSPTVSLSPSPSTSAAPLPCTVLDDFAPGAAGSLVVTDAMKAKANAMGTALCTLVGGGARYQMEEWLSIGGLSGGFNGLTYDVEAHLIGAAAGPVDDEAWLAVYQAPAGTTPTFADGTMITLQTRLAESLKAKIEVQGGPFDAFGAG